MVWDAIMNEERPVTDFTQAELDEDPLIVLPCGHALLVSTAVRVLFFLLFVQMTTHPLNHL